MHKWNNRYAFLVWFFVCGLFQAPTTYSQSVDSISGIDVAHEKVKDSSQTLGYLDVVPPVFEQRQKVEYPWIFILAVIVLLCIGLIRAVALKQHTLSLRTAFSNISNQFEQIDKEAVINPIVILQVLVSAIIIALGLFVIEPFVLPINIEGGFTYFLILFLTICLIYTVKYCVHFLVGLVLQSDDLARLMVIGLSSMLYAFTLLIFPIIVVWYYVPVESIKSIIAMLLLVMSAVFIVWRLIKCATIYYRYFPFAKIYIIIYLCALEITPILVIGKLISLGV